MSRPSKRDIERYMLERFGTTPLLEMMELMVSSEDRSERLDCASRAAPYVHAKLKQVEVHDERTESRPVEEIERDLAAFLVDRLDRLESPDGQRARDLVGDDAGAEEDSTRELH